MCLLTFFFLWQYETTVLLVFLLFFPFLHLKFYYCSHAFLYFLFSKKKKKTTTKISYKHFVVTVSFYSIIASVIIFLCMCACSLHSLQNFTCTLYTKRKNNKHAAKEKAIRQLGWASITTIIILKKKRK